jgi:phosphoribosyl-ATP pyrophosphohydrolase
LTDTVKWLFATIEDRKTNPKSGSYTNFLLDAGEDEIIKKIGEESVEVIIAVKDQGDERVISELADLTYHCLVLLAQRGLSPDDVADELQRRHQPPQGE